MNKVKKVALMAVFLVMKQLAFAQAPWVFPFQAVARYPNSGVIANKAIKVRFTIKNATSTGTTVYQETQSTTTSALGLFSVNVGSGTLTAGTAISTLTWGTALKFLQVEMDTLNTGVSYANLGTQQLLSVPYALNAASVGALTTSGSNIGIGTTTPSNPLSVVGKADFSGDISVNGITVGLGGGNISGNTAHGMSTLLNNTSGGANTATGAYTLYSNTTGTYNSATGSSALYYNSTGNYNNATGSNALNHNTIGAGNSAFGNSTLFTNNTGSYNTAIGFNALYSNTTGGSNAALGNYPLYYNTTGSLNTAIGNSALYYNTTGVQNTAVGNSALLSNITGNSNTALGNAADVVDGLTNATAIGCGAKASASNTIQLGNTSVTSVNTSGSLTVGGTINATSITASGGLNVKGDLNVWENGMPLLSINSGTPATKYTNATNDCVNFHNVSAYNSSLYNSGSYPAFMFYSANNASLGQSGAPTCLAQMQNNGYFVSTGQATWSDKRLKSKIATLKASHVNNLLQLKMYSYFYDNDMMKSKHFACDSSQHFGVMAQELETLFPNLVHTDKNGLKAVNYTELIPIVIQTIQQQQSSIDALKADNKKLKADYDARLKAIENKLNKLVI